ncbi:unnamed protein product [Linum trigynum]|uniref:Uncharacterized protein n=1 Tax=Linum trigynum TaxID=586398 RepID=A0AAV2DC11_9ROSI
MVSQSTTPSDSQNRGFSGESAPPSASDVATNTPSAAAKTTASDTAAAAATGNVAAPRVNVSAARTSAKTVSGGGPAAGAGMPAFSNPLSLSDIEWDSEGIDLLCGGGNAVVASERVDRPDGCILGLGVGALTDTGTFLIERGATSRVGDNLVKLSSESVPEDTPRDSAGEDSVADSPSLALSEKPIHPFQAVADSEYRVRLHADMWEGREVPDAVYSYGLKYKPAYSPAQVLRQLHRHQLPTDWEYAAPSLEGRCGSCPIGWITIFTEHMRLGLEFPLVPLLTGIPLHLNCSLSRLSPSIIFHSICYRAACARLKEEPSIDAFRLLYSMTGSKNCWSPRRRSKNVGFVYGSPKLDSPWYSEYFFARPAGKWYSGDVEPLTVFSFGQTDDWDEGVKRLQHLRPHLDRITSTVQFRLPPHGHDNALEIVQRFHG